jgi:predicted ATPase
MPIIRRITLKNFKRFDALDFEVPGHLVLAGPNNTGKTTLLQAISAWSFGLTKWLELGADHNPRRGFPWQDLERAQFSAVALRSFDLLWRNRRGLEALEIGLQLGGLPSPAVLEFQFQAPGLARVRPRADFPVMLAKIGGFDFKATFIPAIAGLNPIERRLADREAIQDLLSQARAGEVLRNLLVLAHQDELAWRSLNEALGRMFGIALLPPTRGAALECEYKRANEDTAFDISTAGSGVLQVLLVLSLMLTQQGHVLLIDEPDAHLHLILQRTIYGELRAVAAARGSQLLIATHSEQVIDTVDPRELCLMYGVPRLVADTEEKAALIDSLGALTHGDLLAANGAHGVLYVEDYTDADILRAFARALDDKAALRLLEAQLVCKRVKAEAPEGLGRLKPSEHWAMLRMVNSDLPAAELLDGDSQNKAPERVGDQTQLQRLRWERCEIESYLLHPGPLRRFLEQQLGEGRAEVEAGLAQLSGTLGADFDAVATSHSELLSAYLKNEAVSKKLLPAIMQAATLNRFPKNRFFEIALLYKPEEVHPEVLHKLSQLKVAFRVAKEAQAAADVGANDA